MTDTLSNSATTPVSDAPRVSPAKLILPACGLLLLCGFVSLTIARGTSVVVSTNAANSDVRVDGRQGTAITPAAWRFDRVPLGSRQVTLNHLDYVPAGIVVDAGFFGENQFKVEMDPRKVRLQVTTLPAAQVYLNGELIGAANEQGLLDNSQINAGEYDVAVRLPGYQDWQNRAAIRNDIVKLSAYLRITEAHREEMANRRAQALALVQQGRSLFARRSYDAALRAVDEALRLDPGDASARQLREQIAQTMRILQ